MSRRSLIRLLAIATLPLLLGLSSGSSSSPSYRFTRQADPHVETVTGWMLGNSVEKTREAALVAPATRGQLLSYFDLAGRALRLSQGEWGLSGGGPAKTASMASELSPLRSQLEELRPGVEQLIQRQLHEALVGAGLGLRVGGGDGLLPPVLFRFQAPPKLLVVSPRDRITQLSTVLLRSELTLSEAERLEATISGEGFSAMVTSIGGLGVYPSMVPESADLRWTLRTAAHEWVHQFFALRPLGWKYAFGAEKDAGMIAVNETAAEILGREVGDQVYYRYYRGTAQGEPRPSPRDSSFREMMREVRTAVDALLAQGRVDEAESFMESSRQAMARQGYYLRKLNQAYFAFHGSYSDDVSVGGAQGDDIGDRLHRLREASASVGEFAWKVSSAGSYDEFLRLTPDR